MFEVCKSRKLWTIRNIERNLIDDIKNTVGNKKVILGLSGGVDSSVSAVLIHKAIGSQLKCVFVDTGLIRINEKEDVKNLFVKNLNIKVDFVNAKNKFYDKLSNITDPEKKEKIKNVYYEKNMMTIIFLLKVQFTLNCGEQQIQDYKITS